jgi:hypothetical protein
MIGKTAIETEPQEADRFFAAVTSAAQSETRYTETT